MPEEEREGEHVLSRLNPRQRDVFDYIKTIPNGGTAVIGFGGSVGGGKSFLLCRLALQTAMDYPGSRILIGRHHFNDLQTTTLEEFDEITPPQMTVKAYNSMPVYRDLRLRHWPDRIHSRVYFRGLEDWQSLGSEEYNLVLIDEASETSPEVPLMLWTRLRHKLPKPVMKILDRECYVCYGYSRTAQCKFHGHTIGRRPPYLMVAASNPWPGWFEDWFFKNKIDPAVMEAVGGSVKFIPSRIKDNEANLPPGYEAKQRALLPPALARRLLDGEWGVMEGVVYSAFDPDIHEWKGPDLLELEKEKKPLYKRVIGGLDFGSENETTGHMSAGIVMVVTASDRVIVVDEFKERGQNIADRQMAWMLQMQQKWAAPIKSKIRWKADRSQMVGIQLLRNYFNISPSKGGNDSVDAGIKAVSRLLLPDGAGIPGLMYLPHCEKFKDEMRAYRRDVKTLKIVKNDDDICDSLRYGIELLSETWGDPSQFNNVLPRMAS